MTTQVKEVEDKDIELTREEIDRKDIEEAKANIPEEATFINMNKYGNGLMEQIESNSNRVISTITDINGKQAKNSDLAELNVVLEELVKDDPKGLISKVLAKFSHSIRKTKASNQSAVANLNEIKNKISKDKEEIIKDNIQLESLYKDTLGYYKKITILVNALSEKIDEIDKSGKAIQSDFRQNMLLKLQDLKTNQMLLLSTLPNIKRTRETNDGQAKQVKQIITVTIPMTSQLVTINALAKKQAIRGQEYKKINKVADDIYVKTTEGISNSAIQTAQLNGESAINIESIKKVAKIQSDTTSKLEELRKQNVQEVSNNLVELKQLQNDYLESLKDKKGVK